VVVHVYNPNTQEAQEKGDGLKVNLKKKKKPKQTKKHNKKGNLTICHSFGENVFFTSNKGYVFRIRGASTTQ
jgi:hypothetical protein